MTKSWFDKTCDVRRELVDNASTLYRLAQSCEDIGLGMSEDLYSIAASLHDINDDLNKAIGQGVNENFSASEQATKNMLAAALAGTGCITEETLEKILNTKEDQE